MLRITTLCYFRAARINSRYIFCPIGSESKRIVRFRVRVGSFIVVYRRRRNRHPSSPGHDFSTGEAHSAPLDDFPRACPRQERAPAQGLPDRAIGAMQLRQRRRGLPFRFRGENGIDLLAEAQVVLRARRRA